MHPPPGQAVRAAYRAESTALCWQGARTACVLVFLLVPVFGILDAVVFPAEAAFFVWVRLACVTGVAVLLWLLHRPFGRRHALGIGVLVATLVGLTIDAMTVVTGAETSPYYAGVSLVLLAVALLMAWPPIWSLFTSVVLVGGYVVPIVVRGQITDGRILVSNLFFLLSTALISLVSTAFRERLRWQEFINRTALEEALRHKSDFMARMSHELRTPIHVMIGYADILLEDALQAGGDEARQLVDRIRSHGVLLHGLISDLLDYAKVEAGKMDVRPEPIRVDDLVEQVADRFRPLTARKGLDLETVCAGDLPAVVSDRQRLEQILTNLVGNAVKFTERGGVTIEARVAHAGDRPAFRSLTDGETVEAREGLIILVRDTGIGIRDDDLARLAADFEQLDEVAAAKYGGTGLGLSISRKLAQRLGGRIGVRSRYSEGSTFALFLPLAA
jgi:signal transduction histidine kinase